MKFYIERKDESMANTNNSQKLKFTSLDEAKEFLLKSKEQKCRCFPKTILRCGKCFKLR